MLSEYWILVKIFVRHENLEKAIECLLTELRDGGGYEVVVDIERIAKKVNGVIHEI